MSNQTEIPPGFSAAMEYLKASSTTAGDLELTFAIPDVVELPHIPTEFKDIKLIWRSDLIKVLLDAEDDIVVAEVKNSAEGDGDSAIRKTLAAYCVPSKWRQLAETGWTKKAAPPRRMRLDLFTIWIIFSVIHLAALGLYWYIRLAAGPRMHAWLCDVIEAVLGRLIGQGYTIQVRHSKY